ncbi:MAG: carboxypeptidase-like regulatory domain-containing protein [Bacteroidales bacterium]|nr:carboxypeptidase-like regulatory domain-containing protein [Bacteroidales bacterium]
MKKQLLWVCVTAALLSASGAVMSAGPKSIQSGTEVQQQRTVTGVVKDAKGVAIAGANVMEKGTLNGAITDIDGSFKLTVPANATLVVSFIGFSTQEIPVGNQSNLVITLLENSQYLQEVVFVGYGTQKKVNLTVPLTLSQAKSSTTVPFQTSPKASRERSRTSRSHSPTVSPHVAPTIRSVVPAQSARVVPPSSSSTVSREILPCSTPAMWPASLS